MPKTTYSATRPDGSVKTRTSARLYTHARTVIFDDAKGGYCTTFHASEALADRPHPDFRTFAYVVTPVTMV